MDQRTDPIQVITRPGMHIAEDASQVVGAWAAQARKAGWDVEPVHVPVDLEAGERGVVEIEGLRYLIRVGYRARTREVIVPDKHVATHAVETVTGRASHPSRPAFGLTAWAEPVIIA